MATPNDNPKQCPECEHKTDVKINPPITLYLSSHMPSHTIQYQMTMMDPFPTFMDMPFLELIDHMTIEDIFNLRLTCRWLKLQIDQSHVAQLLIKKLQKFPGQNMWTDYLLCGRICGRTISQAFTQNLKYAAIKSTPLKTNPPS